MTQIQLDGLIAAVDFGLVTGTMFAIGTSVLLIHGAWKAYTFVRAAVKGG
ncbi:MAG: hypothetical protein KJ798_02240 [Gammaproteobacteria bacterium]|nr:hypothetical protein [Gammaproteobacteria bacterium]MBU0849798.1 hypothetical protein [Gammaproteobacteria bacterium]MBU1267108.1 hypothetical protein [Gammaproteobacteria bacterium]MBU1527587.1 hypothetical protein [Gammaproteobacteria bacterium]MBU1779181.1 hypothetical protein [Gammaproteobacteria bacterium]